MTLPITAPTVLDYVAAPLVLGEPDVAGPLAVFPVFGPPPRLAYRSFAQAMDLGATVTEVEAGGSVNDLVVINPTDQPILFYEGEEVVGAQQNRAFDVSGLVAAGTKLTRPVSCVQQGRGGGPRHGGGMRPAPQAGHPQPRRATSRRVRASLAADQAPRGAQAEVWAAVAAKADRHGAVAPTGAMHDVYESRRGLLVEV